MSDYNLAIKADEILRANKTEEWHHYVSDLKFRGINADDVTGSVIYIGSGRDLSSLFIFENAQCIIHQELGDPQLFNAFPILEQSGIVSDFQVVSDEPSERRYKLKYKGQEKTFIEVFNSRENLDRHIHNGDVALNVHPLAQEGLDAIYFWAFPYEDTIKAMQINLLPHLKRGGLFEGNYYSLYHYGASPSKLGLVNGSGTYIKNKQLSSKEIESAVRFSIDDYIEKDLHFSSILHEDKPKIREEARKRGVHFK